MIQVRLEWGDEWAHGKFQDACESVRSGHRVGVRMLEWAHGKFQDAYESVRSGHTEWVCECLSGHKWAHGKFQDACESVRSGHTEWVCECLSGQVPLRGSEWCHVVTARRLYMYVQRDM